MDFIRAGGPLQSIVEFSNMKTRSIFVFIEKIYGAKRICTFERMPKIFYFFFMCKTCVVDIVDVSSCICKFFIDYCLNGLASITAFILLALWIVQWIIDIIQEASSIQEFHLVSWNICCIALSWMCTSIAKQNSFQIYFFVFLSLIS